ncbi:MULTISPECIES: DUF2808 domain-containing protein [Leptolyngbya]|uniref:DUF2808 domain-containing protein n=1 Tax=Leptolyngbya boryana CZ1 TaxID=3060204 RepID=A0AA97ATE2_LEPBY|nr:MULTISPECIES: DUF2808 domain-containing protein [Leptolyngbya]MCY6488917.1 DUF2808 domain-containing protein [Leptolyngbya sp. GGD]WNZ48459.1 DUF2808 domain-containing protein [Leptolyngbya boryana CZ1]
MLRKLSSLKARSHFASVFTISAVLLSILPLTARAGQIGGRSYFERAPHLVRTAASNVLAHTPSAYEFTIQVPSDAGAALQTVRIAQEENLDRVSFDPSQSRAFLGDHMARGQSVSLAAIGGERPNNKSETTVTFNPPIQPGQTVTVVLDATANPWQGGVYLFGVTAYPEGDQASGLFLGYGRIHLQSYQ